MAKIVTADAEATHTGSVCTGDTIGTVTAGTNTSVRIQNKLVCVEDMTLEIPVHNNPPCTPPNLQSHSYSPDTFAQSFVRIEGKRMVLVGDSYAGDNTFVSSAGSNTFVEVNP